MTPKVWSGIGAVLVGLGLLVGLVPVSAEGANCGSVIAPEGHLGVSLSATEAAANACDSLLGVLAIPTWALVGLGVLAFGLAFFQGTRRVSQPAQTFR